jgi:GntR family transcriptional regulator, rspAB operon transcriptional repressor
MDPIAIYEDLKEKIIWLDVEPGSTLNLVELTEVYWVSRNPITIALTRLDAEEWVVRNGSHFVVSPLTVDRIREITEIRSVMEVQANIWAMNRISGEGLSRLKTFRDDILNLDDTITNREIVKLDVKFHRMVYRETRNQQLATMLNRMLSHYLRFWLSIPHAIRWESFFKEAMEIIEAVETRDETRLKTATSAHIKASMDQIMGLSP